MSLNFNTKGYLHETIPLSYEELKYHFGTNPRRMDQIKPYLIFFNTIEMDILKASQN
jgi:hypothetical protein